MHATGTRKHSLFLHLPLNPFTVLRGILEAHISRLLSLICKKQFSLLQLTGLTFSSEKGKHSDWAF